jgi:hypothetical protein
MGGRARYARVRRGSGGSPWDRSVVFLYHVSIKPGQYRVEMSSAQDMPFSKWNELKKTNTPWTQKSGCAIAVDSTWLSYQFSLPQRSHTGNDYEGCGPAEVRENPKLTEVARLGPSDEMDRASQYCSRCSECNEIICIAKAVTDGPSTQRETLKCSMERFAHTLNLDTPRTRFTLLGDTRFKTSVGAIA